MGKNYQKKVMQTNNSTMRQFNHTLGEVTINVSFRTDIKQQLKDGREILKTILQEVEEELAKK